MEVIDFTYKRIKAQIFHSYETFMSNKLGELDVHLTVLKERYDPERFTNPKTIEGDIVEFLNELQEEVDQRINQIVLMPLNT